MGEFKKKMLTTKEIKYTLEVGGRGKRTRIIPPMDRRIIRIKMGEKEAMPGV